MRLPPLVRRSDGVHRAAAIPWTKARATRRRQVSWLTGRRSMHAFPGPWAQWLLPWKEARASRSPLTVAGTASASGASSHTAFPFKLLSEHQRDHGSNNGDAFVRMQGEVAAEQKDRNNASRRNRGPTPRRRSRDRPLTTISPVQLGKSGGSTLAKLHDFKLERLPAPLLSCLCRCRFLAGGLLR
jgi:hypothetical protein